MLEQHTESSCAGVLVYLCKCSTSVFLNVLQAYVD